MGESEQGNAELRDPQEGDAGPELVRISVPAAAACVLAVASLLLMLGLMWAFRKDTPESVQNLYLLTQFGAWLFAGILGVTGLIDIGTSGGRRSGKGFAWVGVAVPVAQVLFLFVFVALTGKTHNTAYRMVCGTKLSGIGKAMLIYANDYGDELPRAGGPSSQWTGRVADWTASDRGKAFGLSPDGRGGQVSMSASLYLLVRYAEVTPKVFLCGSSSRRSWEKGMTEFEAGTYRVEGKAGGLTDFWDFGPNPSKHCSYAYHMLYGPSKLTVASDPDMAVAADRNPWMDSPSAKARDFSEFRPDIAPYNGTSEQGLAGNVFRHDGAGQNVMFLDTHVDFRKRSYCGIDGDNIYTSWAAQDKARGVPPKLGSVPADARDSLLVNDPILPSE